jgi:hypothetical protein
MAFVKENEHLKFEHYYDDFDVIVQAPIRITFLSP